MVFSEIKIQIKVPDDYEFDADRIAEDAAFDALDELGDKLAGAAATALAELIEAGVLPKGSYIEKPGF